MAMAESQRFDRLTSFASLLRAASLAARGARGSDALRFLIEREAQVLALQDDLRRGAYRPAAYRTFTISDPKPRTISAAAFRDRVVHHALCAEIEADLERGASHASFACRKGKGTLAAVWFAAGLARQHPFALKLDVEHFFETLSHDVLLAMLRARLREPALLALAEVFVRAGAPGSEPGRGVPIGNLTSQHFANFYLGALDRFVTRGRGVRAYVRYMDDVLVFAPSKDALWAHAAAIDAFTRDRLALRLKARVTQVLPVTEGVPFLGFRLFPAVVRLDGARRRRLVRRVRALERELTRGGESATSALASLQSLVAWSRWGHTRGLRRSLFARSGAAGRGDDGR